MISQKRDFSDRRQTKPGRPSVTTEIEKLVLQFARENRAWGSDRIAGALANPGIIVSDQTVGNVLKKHGLGPMGERTRQVTWAQFLLRHQDVLRATDFFTAEAWTRAGLLRIAHYSANPPAHGAIQTADPRKPFGQIHGIVEAA